jgi:hypothetical protein
MFAKFGTIGIGLNAYCGGDKGWLPYSSSLKTWAFANRLFGNLNQKREF